MKNNELQFIDSIESNKNYLVKKLESTLKTNVVYQLSRPMLNDLVNAYKYIVPNYQLTCNTCGGIILDFVKKIGNLYFELKKIQENELKNVQEIEINLFDYSNKNNENLKNNFIDIEDDENTVVIDNEEINPILVEEKNEIVDFNMLENNENINTEIINKTEIVNQEIDEKITKRGRPKSK